MASHNKLKVNFEWPYIATSWVKCSSENEVEFRVLADLPHTFHRPHDYVMSSSSSERLSLSNNIQRAYKNICEGYLCPVGL